MIALPSQPGDSSLPVWLGGIGEGLIKLIDIEAVSSTIRSSSIVPANWPVHPCGNRKLCYSLWLLMAAVRSLDVQRVVLLRQLHPKRHLRTS